MASYVPESTQLLKRRTASGWDTHYVCRTLITWYPKLLHGQQEHSDMNDARAVLGFLASIQEYPADLQDILLLLARRYGLHKAHQALDNAIRKYLLQRQPRRARNAEENASENASDRLTA